MIALAALIVAVVTLILIMIQNVFPWKFSKLTTRIDAAPSSINDEDWLIVYVYNKSASPIAVTGVTVWYRFERWLLRNYFPWSKVWLRGKTWRNGVSPSLSDDGQDDCTIDAYHTKKWKVDRSDLLKKWATAEGHSGHFLVEVTLATGTKLSKRIPVDADVPPITVVAVEADPGDDD
jgi:hypothetical protein